MLIGYARVSKADGSQSLDLQRDALVDAGVDQVNLYHDLASGVRDDRPGLDNCLRALRRNDTLVVWKLDRLGRNLAHLVNTVQDLSARGVGLRVLAGQGAQIDTTTAAGRLVFGIFAALAEFERELIRERTLAGLKAARARGRKGGRKFALSEGPGAARPGRDGAPRHLGVRTLQRTRDQARDALQVRRAAGPVARAGRESPRHLNRSAATSTLAEHVLNLSVGFRPLPQTTRTVLSLAETENAGTLAYQERRRRIRNLRHPWTVRLGEHERQAAQVESVHGRSRRKGPHSDSERFGVNHPFNQEQHRPLTDQQINKGLRLRVSDDGGGFQYGRQKLQAVVFVREDLRSRLTVVESEIDASVRENSPIRRRPWDQRDTKDTA